MASRKPAGHGESMVGHYQRQESIGKGSFATVYKAQDTKDKGLVAIKTVQHSRLQGKLKSNLFSEIDILKRINHPHIVRLLNILESNNHLHLVMEFCQLGDLATFVRKRHTLGNHPITQDMISKYPNVPGAGFNEVVVRNFARQLGSAMLFLRGRNLVHRDLKPQNLLLNPPKALQNGDRPPNNPISTVPDSPIPSVGLPSMPMLKIADFGFARHLPTTTMAETLCGSPLYMAPEILRYEKYDNKADLWSLGTVIYEMNVGKPPFRAPNHIELLRKIERGNDEIDFPAETVISKEMHQLICGLLRKMPTQRISWETFFTSPVIRGPIPGLEDSDRLALPEDPPFKLKDILPPPIKDTTIEIEKTTTAATSNIRPSADRVMSAVPMVSLTNHRRLSVVQQIRPQMPSHVTEPAIVGVRHDRLEAPLMEKRRSQDSHSADVAAVKPDFERRRSFQRAQEQRALERRAREEREHAAATAAAHEVAFERDYVMVEKRSVEVNAFADEMAANPRLQGVTRGSPTSQVGAMVRRATTQGMVALNSAQASPSRQLQYSHRNEATQHRKLSSDFSSSEKKISTNSAITAALEKVQFRVPFLFSQGKGISPPQNYGPWPNFPSNPNAGPLLIGDSGQPVELHEDQVDIRTIEDHATRSDVVFGFAEVKYKQLIPIAPSNDNKLGNYRSRTGGEGRSIDDEDDLTLDAVIGLSEEALVLYVKALAILTNTIRLAGNWWNRKGRTQAIVDVAGSPRTVETTSDRAAEIRINQVVQWARNRFNECLEKSEYASRRHADSQRRARQSDRSRSHASSRGDENNQETSDIRLISGVTAGKLMYERALELSRAAAVNELVGEDLQGCEMGYTTAIRLLEAVLEEEEDLDSPGSKLPTKQVGGTDEAADGIEEGDRETVLKLIESLKTRLGTLRRKVNVQAAAIRLVEQRSSSVTSSSLGKSPITGTSR